MSTLNSDRLRGLTKWFFPVLGLTIFLIALVFVHHFLKQHSYQDIVASFKEIPLPRLMAAIGCTVVGYLILSFYDVVGFRYAGLKLEVPKIMFGSFVAFALSNSIGLANLAGTSVRMRIYSSFGMEPLKIIKVIAFVSVSFWIGFFALAGGVFTVVGVDVPESFGVSPGFFRWIGGGFLALVAAYLLYSSLSRSRLRIAKFEFEVPAISLSLPQLLIAAADWAISGAALYFLLPPSVTLSYPVFLSIFLSAQVLAILTHVPGGVGILESIIIYFVVPDHHAAPPIVASLVSYRLIYYFIPLVTASLALVGYEAYLKRRHVRTVSKWAFTVLRPLVPAISAVMAFVSGCVLLFSTSTPTLSERSALLATFGWLPLLEVSHFLSSCVGVTLVVLAIGLSDRSRGAWHAALFALLAGAVLSVLKGLDFEEAAILLFSYGIVREAKDEFYRPARLFSDRWTPGWIIALVAVFVASAWLGFFAYRHVEYSHDLWWSFSFNADAPRFLRSLIGGAMTVVAIGMYRLLSPPRVPFENEAFVSIESLQEVIGGSKDTLAQLALLGDKRIFQSESKESFLMYAVSGRTWIVLGDPVGKEEEFEDLIARFLDRADRYQGQVALYQVKSLLLPLYIDAGFIFLKLGEEARVPLETFSLEGHAGKGLRHAFNRMKKQGMTFRIASASQWSDIEADVKRISDAWLGEKSTAEKGFSLGYYDPAYLRRFSLALLEFDGRPLAFANLLEGAEKEELSIDLMRYVPDGPPGLMEQLTIEILLWGQDQGYRFFNLGMAPLSGLEGAGTGSRWNRVAQLVYEHGEHFYNFQGLRRYKEKFHPVWEPRFLAYSSKISLPLVLKDLTLLISGGAKGVISK